MPVVISLIVGLGPAGQSSASSASPSPGWEWFYKPQRVEWKPEYQALVLRPIGEAPTKLEIVADGSGGQATVFISSLEEQHCRFVAFDEHFQRLPVSAPVDLGDGAQGFVIPEPATYLAVETVSAEDYLAIAKRAYEKASASGEWVLPYPVVDSAYAFSLPGPDGKVIPSKAFKGRVVIIDSWATWCFACMKKMPELTALWKEHEKDIVVVSVCRDGEATAKRAREAVAELPEKWHHRHVPIDTDYGELFSIAFSGEENLGLPRIVVLDKGGIVRAILTAEGVNSLRPVVEGLVKASPRK